jgi:fumarate hydratase subunit beta
MTSGPGSKGVLQLRTPLTREQTAWLEVGCRVEIHGPIFCGRDAVLPRLVRLIEEGKLKKSGLELEGSVIFHTAVSPAGIGPTTSNKAEIQESLPALAKAGVRIHLGKGSLSPETIEALAAQTSVFAVTPPVSALFSDKIVSQEVAAFGEEGMEALFRLEVRGFPAIIAAARGKSIFSGEVGS